MEEEYEEFRTIDEFPHYMVSDNGRIWNTKTKKYLKGTKDKDDYIIVSLGPRDVRKAKRVHVLVATTFLENPENKPCVDHINNIPFDNRLCNLRFATIKENSYNSKLSSLNKSGYKGVSFVKRSGKWRADITIDGILVCLGTFKTIEVAHKTRIKKAHEVFGVYTNTIEKV